MPNPDRRLAPGMFAKVEIALDEVEGATVVPRAAITQREDVTGVFVVEGGSKVAWRPVEIGVEAPEQVQLLTEGLVGRQVVISGQHLLDDGSTITIPAPAEPADR